MCSSDLDIFSYAVTCFEMYSKRFPWDAALTIDAVLQHINKPPLEITTIVPGIDSQIAAAIMKGLKANPDERWQKIGEMVAEIREAEMRLVKLAREAAAAKAKAAGSASPATATPAPTQTTATQAATAADRSQQAGKPEAAGKPAVQGDAAKQAGKKPARNKKRSGDDDIDLTALFAE